MITDQSMRHQVEQVVDRCAGTYDVGAIVRELIDKYGRVDIDSIDDDAFWPIVMDHATS